MKHYVVGFLFDGPFVLLLRKTHPEWQAGRLNGVGGHIEDDESADEAMEREFLEEAGIRIKKWKHFASLSCPEKYMCHFFMSNYRKQYGEPRSKTEEKIEWVCLDDLMDAEVVPNLRWLVPLALDSEVAGPVEIFTS